MSEIELFKDFKPVTRFKKYNLIVVSLVVIILWLCIAWIIPVFENTILNIIVVALLIVSLLVTVVWNSLYYKSIVYHLNETEMTWKRGVWFRQTGIVPYNRITNVDIVQGPLMRIFGISNLRIQTAGYSAQNVAEIRITGIEEPEPLREMIMGFVRSRGPAAAATGGDDSESSGQVSSGEILDELREIRKILNKMAEK
ncbi:membrane-flanked domain protein [Methanolacinia petrolearia DSM 11571]|uniref:Membrane-flanked domain protein n=1 Tax=Methanolacinia petrolearia (strain DSM 11571 / OCM 486 / SEBR 4847) TaxID=679926 RepID=E1RED7_METP4|nr:PH domain-containing protein [Methanolacinia petrolearia]ADN37180.1 membrane-flanked domain protein [Methanolacinia petrolearia DSM 11571]